ncbi:MAG: nucleotidyltransferase domain-containing protein [Myxococcota bacterium]|nr:nucleotidyltransferase domain-containing protein [Myxococcota bacterium]
MAVAIDWGEESAERTAEMEAEAQRLAEALGRLGALEVILFGSRARGKPRTHSDIDLLAVMPCDPSWTFARRLAEIGALVDPRFATDLLVYTPEEFARLRETRSFVRDVEAHGRVLFRRDAEAPTGGSGGMEGEER